MWTDGTPVIPAASCAGSYGGTASVNLAVGGVYNFDYSGKIVCATLVKSGYYKLEAWGAQGGYAYTSSHFRGGYGGYSLGLVKVAANTATYVVVGGKGTDATSYATTASGGFNGGGYVYPWQHMNVYSGSGGGVTHFSLITGLLQNLSSQKGTLKDSSYYVSSKILVAAGGGGGGGACYPVRTTCGANGGNGGGIKGGDSNAPSSGDDSTYGLGGTQTTGGSYVYGSQKWEAQNGSFGLGGSSLSNYGGASGGGGWFGGGGSAGHNGGGGGSGYIASSYLVSKGSNVKHMTCYSCTTSTAAETRTNSNTNVSGTAIADYSKTGNGYARITYLGTSI